MDKMQLPKNELVHPGHLACQGCGAVIAMKFVLKALGRKTIIVIPASCCSVICGPFPYSALKIPIIHTAFETTAATASGVKASLDIQRKKDINVLAWAGDGGTFDIGLQSLSGAFERNEDIIYVCYDNEAYMNTGIQRSSATPLYAWTTTTPEKHPKDRPKKDIIQVVSAHKIPYAATANIAFPDDLIKKIKKAKKVKGSRFIHIISPCPPGWKIDSSKSIKIARLATHTNIFPLYEVYNGEDYVVNVEPKMILVKEYLKLQGRFSHLTRKEIKDIQKSVDYEWRVLLSKSMME